MLRIALALLLLPLPALAAPRAYVLDQAASSVGFQAGFGPDRITGSFPVAAAELSIDFAALGASTVRVVMDVTHGSASFPFATEAMQGPKVLDARQFPQMTFTSTAVRKAGDGARVEGILTLRGVARPVTLEARIYRQRGTEAGDLSHLTILLHGAVNRSDFGATGWADMVGDRVEIDIRALIREAG